MRLVTKNLSMAVIIAGLSFWGTACNNNKVSGSQSGQGPLVEETDDGDETGTAKPDVNPIDELVSSYGLLNFRQLAATFESVTGVKLDNQAVLTEYEKQLSSLPKSFDAAAISAAKVSAVTKLAASYCDVLSQNAQLMTAKIGSDAATLATSTDAEYAEAVLEAFFGPETALQGTRSVDVASVSGLLAMLRAVPAAGNLQQAMFMGTCASVLSSAEFFMY